jgi:hypothetical protein
LSARCLHRRALGGDRHCLIWRSPTYSDPRCQPSPGRWVSLLTGAPAGFHPLGHPFQHTGGPPDTGNPRRAVWSISGFRHPCPKLVEPLQRAGEFARGEKASNTRRAYKSDMAAFSGCVQRLVCRPQGDTAAGCRRDPRRLPRSRGRPRRQGFDYWAPARGNPVRTSTRWSAEAAVTCWRLNGLGRQRHGPSTSSNCCLFSTTCNSNCMQPTNQATCLEAL